jgi:hypothetical protein
VKLGTLGRCLELGPHKRSRRTTAMGALEKLHTVNAEKGNSLHWSDEFPEAVGKKAGKEKVKVEI